MAEKPIVLKYPIEILNPNLDTTLQSPEGDEKEIRKQYLFADGKWMPGAEPLTIGEKNFTDVKNVRQGEGCIEGVEGYTKQYTSVFHSIYYKARTGIQLRALYSTKSRLIGQFWSASLGHALLYENIASIPESASFIATSLYSDTSGAAIGKFAIWPDNQMVYCNGKENKIYGGDEIRCAAFITVTTEVTAAETTTPQNYTQQVINDLQTNDEMAHIGGENDTNCLLLLPFDGGDSAVITDRSLASHGDATIVGGARTTTSYAKFGDACLGILSASAYIRYAQHANWNSVKTIEMWMKDMNSYAYGSFISAIVRTSIAQISNCALNVVAGDTIYVRPVSGLLSGVLRVAAVTNSTLTIDTADTLTSEAVANLCMYQVKSVMGRYQDVSNYWQLLKYRTDSNVFQLLLNGMLSASVILTPQYFVSNISEGIGGDFHHLALLTGLLGMNLYESQYPTQDNSHVMVTTYYDGNYNGYNATNPANSLVGTAIYNEWNSTVAGRVNQRFHVDLGSAKTIKRIYYENSHSNGNYTNAGVKNFTFWGSNTEADFLDLVYANDGTWVQLTTEQSAFDQHITANQADPKYITVTNVTPYRYYAFKFADNYGSGTNMGVRRIELQSLVVVSGATVSNMFFSGQSVVYSPTILTLPNLASAYIRFGETQRCASAGRDVAGGGLYYDEIRLSDFARYVTNFDVMTRAYAMTGRYFLIGSTRLLKGVKLCVPTGNGNSQTSVLTMKTWNGISWESVTITDGTSTGGIALAQTGTITWADTISQSKPKYIEGYVLYWYQFTLSAGESQIYKVTLDAAIQDVNDLWNGEQVLIGGLLKYENNKYEDYTDYANDSATDTYMSLFNIATSNYALMGFPVPMCGFMLDVVTDKVNQTISSSMAINYCNGGAVGNWPLVRGFQDGTTQGNSITLAQTGVVFFDPLDKGEEFKTAITNDNKLYYYKMHFTVPLGSGSACIWRVKGIPAPQKILPYRFPFNFKNRPMLCGLEIANEGNRVDYGETDTFAFFNGSDSSLGVDGAPLYFGGNENLTGACEVFNRIGSTLYHIAVFTKDNSTYILNGYDKESYQIFTLSNTLGCPAPETMDTIEIGYGDKVENMKCIALWMTHRGPVIFDTTNLVPIWDDVKCYFDKTDTRCINYNAIDKAIGWVDAENMEYNICFPSGTGQTTNNEWIFYDLKKNKWWRKIPAAYPQGRVKVTDEHGTQYVYGFFDDGIMRRLDHGKQWDATDIERFVVTAPVLPTGDMWDITRLRRLKVITGMASETAMLSITHIGSGASVTSGTVLTSFSMNNNSMIYIKNTQELNLLAWSHQLKLALTGNVTDKGLKLVAWGGVFNRERDDL
jgi:hypothetical protein